MRPSILAAVLIIALIAFFAARRLIAQDAPTSTITYENMERRYALYVPSGYDENTPVPLLIVLHPAGGNRATMQSAFNPIAEREGFIAVYPEGPYGYWDYGAGTPSWDQFPEILDDPGYVAAVVDEVEAAYSIDPLRIYAAGYSNGARMAFRLGCSLSPRIAGIAAVAATISDEIISTCGEANPVSAIYIQGTEDGVIPWEGKPLRMNGVVVAQALSAPATGEFWATHNGCDAEPTVTALDDLDPRGRITITQRTYAGCESETTVEFYGVNGGGHQWQFVDGFDTAETIWAFFAAHPRVEAGD